MGGAKELFSRTSCRMSGPRNARATAFCLRFGCVIAGMLDSEDGDN